MGGRVTEHGWVHRSLSMRRSDPPAFPFVGATLPASWDNFLIVAGLGLAMLVAVLLAETGFYAILRPETGSKPGLLPPPCGRPASVQPLDTLVDPASGIRIAVPQADWTAEIVPTPWRRAVWSAGRLDLRIEIDLLDHFPGRPRIDYRMHGIGALERCRVPWAGDSAWIASGFGWNNPDYRVAIAILPQPDERWLRVQAYASDDVDRQRMLLAAVRTARIE